MRAVWRIVRRVINAVFATRVGTVVAKRLFPVLDAIVFRLTGGRATFVGLVNPTLVLESTGARSGQVRRNPLLYARDGQRLFVAGTNWGQQHHPAWTANLLARPEAVVHLGRRSIHVRAVPLLDAAERTECWRRLDKVYGGYARYREATADIREIRMFALQPAGQSEVG